MQPDHEPGLTRRDAEFFRAALRTAAKGAGLIPTPPANPKPTERTCKTCEHWKPLAESDTGGQCVIGKYRDCRPLLNEFRYWSPRASP